jgi:hypothetical protein
MLGEAPPRAPPRTILQLKCDGIDLRSFGNISDLDHAEIFTARPDAAAWWRLAVRGGAFISGVYVGPPGTARHFTRVLQGGADLAAFRRELRDGNLDDELSRYPGFCTTCASTSIAWVTIRLQPKACADTHGTLRSAKARRVAAIEPSMSMARQASSTTSTASPSRQASSAE